MQVHQLVPPSLVQQQQLASASSHFSSPPPSMISPGNNNNNYFAGDEGGRSSHSPNQNAHACSHSQCSASFPTIELLEKHELINHSSGATNVVCRKKTNPNKNIHSLIQLVLIKSLSVQQASLSLTHSNMN